MVADERVREPCRVAVTWFILPRQCGNPCEGPGQEPVPAGPAPAWSSAERDPLPFPVSPSQEGSELLSEENDFCGE